MVALSLLVLIPTLSFAGGQGQKDPNKKDLQVLNYSDNTAPNAMEDQKWLWDTFKKNNPDVTLKVEDLFNEPFHSKTEAYAASGNLPDVLYVWPSGRSTTLHEKGLLKNLTPLINRDNLRASYIPAAFDVSQMAANSQTLLPIGITTTHVMFVNLEVLRDCNLQPARTYAELKAQVPVLRAKGYETIIMPNQDTWVMQSCLFSAIAGRFCGAGWENNILAGTAKFTDPDFVKALDFIRLLYADGVIAQSSLGLGYGEGPGMFATNKGAYYIDGDWRAGAFITDSETGQALISPARQANILVTVFPDIADAKLNKSSSTILGVGWAMDAKIPAGSPREDASWRLIKWLVGKENQELQLRRGGIATPVRSDINFASLNLEPISQKVGAIANEFTTGTVVIDGVFHSDVFNPLNDGLQEIGLGQKTPQQVAADTQKAFDTARAAGKF